MYISKECYLYYELVLESDSWLDMWMDIWSIFKYTKNTLYNLNLVHSAALVHPLQWSSSTETIFFFPKRNKAMNKKTSRINSVLVLSLQDCTNLIWICVPVPGSIKSLILEARQFASATISWQWDKSRQTSHELNQTLVEPM